VHDEQRLLRALYEFQLFEIGEEFNDMLRRQRSLTPADKEDPFEKFSQLIRHNEEED